MKELLENLEKPRTTLDGIYRGVVEDNKDPKEAGRCRIRVFSIHTKEKNKTDIEGIPTEELPWAEPCAPIFGGISKVGIFGVPLQGAHVFLFFEAGNPMAPRYFATAPGIPYRKPDTEMGFNDPDGEYPTVTKRRQPDWNAGENSTSEYPDNFVISTKCGHSIEIDSTDDNERIIIRHGKTGACFELDVEGNAKIDSKKSIRLTAEKIEYYLTGNNNLNVSGEYSRTSGDANIQTNGMQVNNVSGSKNDMIGGVATMKAGEVSTNAESDHNTVAGGKNNMVAGKSILIKSKEDSIKVQAPLNIDVEATVAAKLQGTATADVKSTGISTVTGTAMVKTTGLVAMHEATLLYNSSGLLQIHGATGLNWVKGKIIMLGG